MTTLAPVSRPAEVLLWAAPMPSESEFVLEDPLALDYLGQQVGYFLLPALTTRSGQAQYFAMVLYGLDLAERALTEYGLPDEDRTRRELFERWERLWALALVESYGGELGRGHPDAIRGARGVAKAWVSGERPLPRDYPLISRQSELGGLGAYLVPLRDLGLVYPGSLRVTPAATSILDAFWGEPGTMHMQRFDNWAMQVLAAEILYPLISQTIDARIYQTVRQREKWLEFLLGAPPDVQDYASGEPPPALPAGVADRLRIDLRPWPVSRESALTE